MMALLCVVTLLSPALVASPGTPDAITHRLSAEVVRGLSTNEAHEAILKLGLEPAPGTPEQLAALIADENARWPDIVKAAGTAHVQLWNLEDPNGQALLGQWQVRPAELHKCWISALVSDYRIILDVSATPELLAQPLTVKVTFTDYLTGEIFRDQHVIKPQPR